MPNTTPLEKYLQWIRDTNSKYGMYGNPFDRTTYRPKSSGKPTQGRAYNTALAKQYASPPGSYGRFEPGTYAPTPYYGGAGGYYTGNNYTNSAFQPVGGYGNQSMLGTAIAANMPPLANYAGYGGMQYQPQPVYSPTHAPMMYGGIPGMYQSLSAAVPGANPGNQNIYGPSSQPFNSNDWGYLNGPFGYRPYNDSWSAAYGAFQNPGNQNQFAGWRANPNYNPNDTSSPAYTFESTGTERNQYGAPAGTLVGAGGGYAKQSSRFNRGARGGTGEELAGPSLEELNSMIAQTEAALANNWNRGYRGSFQGSTLPSRARALEARLAKLRGYVNQKGGGGGGGQGAGQQAGNVGTLANWRV